MNKPALIALLLALLLLSCTDPGPDSGLPKDEVRQAQLETVLLKVGPTAILTAEVAGNAEQRATGLMYREKIGENEGMIFIFDAPQRASFWMKNTKIPLSIAFIDGNGEILEIHHLDPGMLDSVASRSEKVLYALEVNRDWFARNGVGEGMKVKPVKGSLSQMGR